MAEPRASSAADYLAAERTFLAWIRTGLALMGLGFVVARFGLFLQALQLSPSNPIALPYGLSFWFGTGFLVLGVIVNVASMLGHIRLIGELKRGGTGFARPSALAIGIALALAAGGLAMAVYLVSVRNPAPANKQQQEKKAMTANTEPGIITLVSSHGVDETVEKLEKILAAKGVKLFAVVDHSGEAASVGLEMRNTKLLIFGNPKAGTPLMVASPTAAIDLPLKILVWENSDGKVRISYNSPSYLQARHGLPGSLIENISVVGALATAAAE